MLQACSKHYRPNRLGRVLFMGARGRFAFGRSRPRPSVRKGCLRLAQSGRREAGRMAAPAGKLTTTASKRKPALSGKTVFDRAPPEKQNVDAAVGTIGRSIFRHGERR